MADVARTPPVGVAGVARAPPASAAGVAEARGRVNSVSVAARGVEADRHTSSWSNCTVPQAIEDIRFALQSTGEERDALEMVMTMMAVSCFMGMLVMQQQRKQNSREADRTAREATLLFGSMFK